MSAQSDTLDTAKALSVRLRNSPTTSPTITAWVRVAMQDETFTTSGTQTIRFGDAPNWVTKTMSGAGVCNRGFFGSDPAGGAYKQCEVQLTVPAVAQTGTLPVVNTALIPKPGSAYNTTRVRPLNSGEQATPNFLPARSDIGAFREPCNYSHMAFDDPIVYPNKPGASHLHTFFGNTQANASSTGDSLMNGGDSTCAGGTLNRTAYWMPSLIDVRSGQPLPPTKALFYYKQGYAGVKPGQMQSFPKGLRMIAGTASNTAPLDNGPMRIECRGSADVRYPTMPSCAVGETLLFMIIFPQCWDGINLDSPNHKSHMAYATGNGCPSTHPVAFPEIAMNVEYRITEANSAAFLRLSSDANANPGGVSLHADWFNGWDPATNAAFVAECLNKTMDCHAYLLGDGRTLY